MSLLLSICCLCTHEGASIRVLSGGSLLIVFQSRGSLCTQLMASHSHSHAFITFNPCNSNYPHRISVTESWKKDRSLKTMCPPRLNRM
jgi:hypothetical protein